MQKDESWLYVTLYTKTKQVIELNLRTKYKILEQNREINPRALRLDKDFLSRAHKA